MNKNLLLVFGIIFLLVSLGFVSSADYLFQNKSGTNLTIIHGDTGNLTVRGNVSASAGFFSWIGSLTSRVFNLFVQNIDFTGNINGSGNITITGRMGIGTEAPSNLLDVRGLANFSGGILINNQTNIATWESNVSRNWTLNANTYTDGRITAVNATAQQALTINTSRNIQNLYNATALMIAQIINTTLNIQNLLAGTNISQYAFNQTLQTFNTYNSTWDESWFFAMSSANDTSINNTANIQNLINGTNMKFGNVDFNNGWTSGGASIIGGNLFAQTVYVYNISSLSVNNILTNGSLFPSIDNSFDLGNSSKRWRNLYLSGTLWGNGTFYYNNGIPITALNETGLINSVNITANIGVLYNATASMIANLSAGQYQAITNASMTNYNLTMYNFVLANNLSQFNYVNNRIVALNTTANIGVLYNATASMIANLSISQLSTTLTNSAWNVSGTNVYLNNPAYNVGIGTTSPTNKLEVNGSTLNYQGSGYKHYQDLVHYSYNSANVVGTMKITMPRNWSSDMMVIKITGYDYSGVGAWEVVVSGYDYTITNIWYNYKAEIRGRAPFNLVRLGNTGSNHVILLGDTTTIWKYPQIAVTDLYSGFSSADWSGTWTISNITSEEGILGLVTPTIDIYTSSTGNVGIGTSSPLTPLHISNSVASPLTLQRTATGNVAITFNSSSYGLFAGMNQYGEFAVNNQLDLENNPRFIVNVSSGNVGIGTTSPTQKLEILETSAGAITSPLLLTNYDSTSGSGVAIRFNAASAKTRYAEIQGIQEVSTNEIGLAFVTGAGAAITEKMRINAYGNVGIGTTTPLTKLEIQSSLSSGNDSILTLSTKAGNVGTGNIIGAINFSSNDASGYGTGEVASIQAIATTDYVGYGRPASLVFKTATNNTDVSTEKMRITDSGNVGIGTTSPETQLHIQGTGNAIARITAGTSSVARLDLGDSDDTDRAFIQYNNNGDLMTIATNAGTRMAIDSSGKVGIGTNAPAYLLDINGSSAVNQIIRSSSTQATLLQINNTNTNKVWNLGVAGTSGWAPQGGFVIDENSVGVRFYIQNNTGNVGIGTTSPEAKLHILGQDYALPATSGTTTTGLISRQIAGISNVVLDTGGNGAGGMWVQSTARTDLSLTFPLLLNPNGGNVGIGTTSPTNKLDVDAGSIRINTNSGTSYGLVIGNHTSISTSTLKEEGLQANYIPSSRTMSFKNVLWGVSYEPFLFQGSNFSVNTGTGSTTNSLFVGSDGKVGIGTATPSQTLDVRGQGNFSSGIYFNNNTLVIGNLTASQIANLSAGQYQAVTNASMTTYNLTMYNFVLANNLSNFNYVNNRIVALNTTANIGVLYNATASMIANLSISQLSTTLTNSAWNVSGTNVYLNNPGNKVGIGTSSPSYLLQIKNVINSLNVSGILYVVSNYVGIGTSNPVSALTIEGGGITIGGTPQIGNWNSRVPKNNTISFTNVYGVEVSMTIGVDGLPIIAFQNQSTYGLGVIHCNTLDCSSYTVNKIYSGVSVGTGNYPSIAIGVDGLPIISSMNDTVLEVSHCGTVDCSSGNINTIIATSVGWAIGQKSSLSIGVDGLPIISYYDLSSSNIKVAHCGTVDCSSGNTFNAVVSVGSNQYVSEISISIGVDGFPVISYGNWTSPKLKFVKCADISCTPGLVTNITLDQTGTNSGAYNSITIGIDGLPIVSYYDDNGDDLKFVHCGNIDCTSGNLKTVLDTSGSVGSFNSITIGVDGLPIISYYDTTNTNLKVAHCGTVDCSSGNTNYTVYLSAEVDGIYNSIAIGVDGLPIISYLDETNNKINILKCGSINCIPFWTRR